MFRTLYYVITAIVISLSLGCAEEPEDYTHYIDVLKDSLNPQSEQISIRYHLYPATGEREKTLIVLLDPMVSSVDEVITYFTSKVREKYDIAFMDLRGSGGSDFVEIYEAIEAFQEQNPGEKVPPELYTNLKFVSTRYIAGDLLALKEALVERSDEKIAVYVNGYASAVFKYQAAISAEIFSGVIFDGVIYSKYPINDPSHDSKSSANFTAQITNVFNEQTIWPDIAEFTAMIRSTPKMSEVISQSKPITTAERMFHLFQYCNDSAPANSFCKQSDFDFASSHLVIGDHHQNSTILQYLVTRYSNTSYTISDSLADLKSFFRLTEGIELNAENSSIEGSLFSHPEFQLILEAYLLNNLKSVPTNFKQMDLNAYLTECIEQTNSHQIQCDFEAHNKQLIQDKILPHIEAIAQENNL
jgi:hypothetical protein